MGWIFLWGSFLFLASILQNLAPSPLTCWNNPHALPNMKLDKIWQIIHATFSNSHSNLFQSDYCRNYQLSNTWAKLLELWKKYKNTSECFHLSSKSPKLTKFHVADFMNQCFSNDKTKGGKRLRQELRQQIFSFGVGKSTCSRNFDLTAFRKRAITDDQYADWLITNIQMYNNK